MASEHRLFGAANHKPGSFVARTGRFLERGNRGVSKKTWYQPKVVRLDGVGPLLQVVLLGPNPSSDRAVILSRIVPTEYVIEILLTARSYT